MTIPVCPQLEPHAWATATFGEVQLGDARRTRRLVSLAAALTAAPSASLPAAVGDAAARKAAYRFLDDATITVPELTAPHRAQTLAAATDPVVLLVQDTSEIDHTRHTATTGLGPIGNGRGRGYWLHSALAIRPTGEVLGLAHLEPFLRVPPPRRGERCSRRRDRPRESQVWERAVTAIGAPPDGTRWVHVGDRGADIFTLFATCHDQGGDWLIRVAHDRRAATDAGELTRVRTAARTLAPGGERRTVTVPARAGQSRRTATVAVGWTPLTLRPPADVRVGPWLAAWVVRVGEPDPPPDVTPLEWVLVTSVSTETEADAWERVAWYTRRWLIEDYHQALKTGCRVEASPLRERDALWRRLAILTVVAVWLLQLRAAARTGSDALATTVLDPVTVRVVAHLTHGDAATLTAAACWKRIAGLGGHAGRQSDGEPGWRTVWRGWAKVAALVEGVQLAAALPP